MSKDKIVSIVVPVYGVELYLRECLDSLLNQTYENIEVILVDDESPDKCPRICDEYAKKDNRVKVIHQKNGGAGNARNTGLAHIHGEYVCFVDSDDYVAENYIESLITGLNQEDADIAVSGFYTMYVDEMIASSRVETKVSYSNTEYLRYFLQDWSCSLIWNKIFKADLLEDIRFVEGRKIDDEFFTYQTVIKAKKIVYVDECLYYYRMRMSGVMSQSTSSVNAERVFKDQHDYYVERYEKVINQFPDLKPLYLENLLENLISLKHRAYGFSNIQGLIQQSVKKYDRDFIFGPVPFKSKYIFWRNMLLPAKQLDEIKQRDKMEKQLFS